MAPGIVLAMYEKRNRDDLERCKACERPARYIGTLPALGGLPAAKLYKCVACESLTYIEMQSSPDQATISKRVDEPAVQKAAHRRMH
jgi:hypothetical protein